MIVLPADWFFSAGGSRSTVAVMASSQSAADA
jgi:hypothetical protein